MSVVLVGVIPATMYAMKTAENRAKASCLARQTLEGIAVKGFDKAVDDDPAPVESNGTTFRTRVTIDPVLGPTGATLNQAQIKKVQVTVTWMERNLVLDYTVSVVLYRP